MEWLRFCIKPSICHSSLATYVCVHWAISYKGVFYSRFPNGLYWSIDPYWHRATARCVCLCKCPRPWPHGQFGNPNLLFIVHLLSTTLKSLQTSYHLSYGTLVSKLIVISRNGHTHNNIVQSIDLCGEPTNTSGFPTQMVGSADFLLMLLMLLNKQLNCHQSNIFYPHVTSLQCWPKYIMACIWLILKYY